MNESSNIEIVKGAYDDFSRGNLPGIIARIADEGLLWGVVSAANTEVPWHLQAKDKREVATFFEALLGTIEFTRFEPHDFAATGDHVYVTLEMEARVKKSGKLIQLPDTVHHFVLKSGKIIRWRASEDTALTRDALRP